MELIEISNPTHRWNCNLLIYKCMSCVGLFAHYWKEKKNNSLLIHCVLIIYSHLIEYWFLLTYSHVSRRAKEVVNNNCPWIIVKIWLCWFFLISLIRCEIKQINKNNIYKAYFWLEHLIMMLSLVLTESSVYMIFKVKPVHSFLYWNISLRVYFYIW